MQEECPSNQHETSHERPYRREQGKLLLLWQVSWQEGIYAEAYKGALPCEKRRVELFQIERGKSAMSTISFTPGSLLL
jgi:hypothetical protein